MSRAPLTTAPSTPIEDAARIMHERKVGALPVVYASRLEGIITESDICRALIEIVGAREGGVRVTFEVGEDEDVVALVAEITRKHGSRVASLLSMEQHGADGWPSPGCSAPTAKPSRMPSRTPGIVS